MDRCLYCGGRVWPWDRQGWRVGVGRWHAGHYLQAAPQATLTGAELFAVALGAVAIILVAVWFLGGFDAIPAVTP